ncbi:MAG: hypothetical protein ACXWMV_06375, partial [Syntrophales bacterium]
LEILRRIRENERTTATSVAVLTSSPRIRTELKVISLRWAMTSYKGHDCGRFESKKPKLPKGY